MNEGELLMDEEMVKGVKTLETRGTRFFEVPPANTTT